MGGRNALNTGLTLSESGYNYTLADMHASDNGSVIVSWVRNKGSAATIIFTPTRFRLRVSCCGAQDT